jgi:hypothetical protein
MGFDFVKLKISVSEMLLLKSMPLWSNHHLRILEQERFQKDGLLLTQTVTLSHPEKATY